jgi:hypothetical protein
MRYQILLYCLVAATITGCSSVYKASQTPDDVYYSPARAGVQKQTAKTDRYENYLASEDDQYLRMKIRNRDRWSGIDDYSYWNDSRYVPMYNYNYDYYRNNMYNTYAWNNWNMPYSGFYYNPYSYGFGSGFGGGIYMNGYYPRYTYGYNSYGYNPYGGATFISKNPTRVLSPSVNRPNLNSYRNGLYDNSNTNRNLQNTGGTLKRVFSPNVNARTYSNENTRSYSNENTFSSPQRTYSPSSSGSSSSGSSGGGGVSRPPR